jgi:beta-phosphoglucomutase-like phosphatase (HAD superfamily)
MQARPVTQALIFDMDGTMIDSMPFHAKSWVAFARNHHLNIDVADLLRRTTGRTGAECMHELFQRSVAPTEVAALVAEKEGIYRDLFAPEFREVSGFKAFSELAVARGLKFGIGTAGDRHNIEFALGHLKMKLTPNAVVGGDEGFAGKPNPDIFLEAAHRMGVKPEHCIVFEDAPFGIEAAKRAGMRAVAVLSSHSALELAGPHVVASVRNFDELIELNFLEKLHAATA